MTSLYLIDLQYITSVEEVDKHRPGHMKFLEKYYDNGLFICSGPKKPRTGGVILTRADSKEAVEKIIQEDPFHQHQLAEFKITEFDLVMSSDALVLDNQD